MAKKEVGKGSKLKQSEKEEMENRKPGTRNLNKLPLNVPVHTISHCCQSIILSNTSSGLVLK